MSLLMALFGLLFLTISISSSCGFTLKDTESSLQFLQENNFTYGDDNPVPFGGCANNPCKNGGSCKLINQETLDWKCECASPFYGKTCDFRRNCDPCISHPCKKGAKCKVEGNEAKCDCPAPHFGEICERSPCNNNPCQNNATCYIEDGKTKCSCAGPFTGELCEKPGCFHGSSVVLTRTGEKIMEDLKLDDEVASGFDLDGSLIFSPVIAFLHKDIEMESIFIQLKTESKSTLLVTEKHLLFRSTGHQNMEAVYAERIRIGDILSTRTKEGMISETVVTEVKVLTLKGVYAPLTLDGTIIVNDILASCYAEVDSHDNAHLAFVPFRMYYHLKSGFKSLKWIWSNPLDIANEQSFQFGNIDSNNPKVIESLDSQGIHWYPKMLCWLTGK